MSVKVCTEQHGELSKKTMKKIKIKKQQIFVRILLAL